MQSVSLLANDLAQLKSQLSNSRSDAFSPTVGIVFCSKKHDMEGIGEIFQKEKIQMVGCSTAGEIVDSELHEGAIATLLMDISPEHFRVHFSTYEKQGIYSGAFKTGNFAKMAFANPGLILMSGCLTVDANVLMAGLKDGVGKEIPMYGGLAADDLSMSETWAFTHEKVSNNGLASLIIDNDKYSMEGLATSGWEALGGVNTITKAEGNVVHSINEEPAYDLFIRYFGLSENAASEAEQLVSIQTNYPFQIQREEGHSVLRSPIVLDAENKTITLAAGVEDGEKFRFSNSPGFEVVERTVAEFGQLRAVAQSADAAILFSCKGRHGAFGPVLEEEIEGIYDHWKTPLVGFLSYGEIGNMGSGVCDFHNETCALVLIKEK